jgi:hypothetical protein
MRIKRDLVDEMIPEGIDKYILIGENILNFHADIQDYYDEWLEEVPDGWMAMINLRSHVIDELSNYGLDAYFLLGGKLDDLAWRTAHPRKLFEKVQSVVQRRLG